MIVLAAQFNQSLLFAIVSNFLFAQLRIYSGEPMKHLTSLFDITADDLENILSTAEELKAKFRAGERPDLLKGYVLVQIFEKPSLRTRNSFETAMLHLGAGGIFLTEKEAGLNGRESLADIARVISSYSDFIVLRTFSQQRIVDFANLSGCPIVNGLSDDAHPCQAMTDLLTMREAFGDICGKHLVYVGDGNNVAKSLAIATSMAGVKLTIAAPEGFQLDNDFLKTVSDKYSNANVEQSADPKQAVSTADVVYTDVWASMGQESEANERKAAFADFQVNAELLAAAPSTAKFMHDLPAKRGLEVTDEVIDGPQSIVFQQAENRMHLAKGLFVWLAKAAQ